jgi:16S rRNA (guanine(527)-N(7))-methyltransferase RsmG
VEPIWIRAAEYAGIEPDPLQMTRMERYRNWLLSEAMEAGGIGPSEAERVDRRHLADSVLFLSQFPETIDEVWDLGTGVGLPGVPMAICRPGTRFCLVDRSGRRVDMLRRAIRILELDNCEVWRCDIEDLKGRSPGLVARASLPPDAMTEVAERHLSPGGVAVMAGSWRQQLRQPGWTTVEIPPYVLDQAVWLLMMRRE